MSSAPAIGSAGLYTSPNQIDAPPGALVAAENCVIRSKGVIEPRRGHDLVFQSLSTLGVFHSGIEVDATNTIWHQSNHSYGVPATSSRIWSKATGVSLGSFDAPAPDALRMRFERMLSRAYCTTSVGPQRILTPTTAATRAGVPAPNLFWFTTFATANTGGFLPVDSACAYRATILKKDAAGREIQSGCSPRLVVINPPAQTAAIGGVVRTGGNLVTVTTPTAHRFKPGDSVVLSPGEANFAAGTKTVITVPTGFTFTYNEAGLNVASTVAQTFQIGAAQVSVNLGLPEGDVTLDTTFILRLARTPTVPSASTAPSEDYYLVTERNLTGADISNPTGVIVVDNTPDAVLGPIQYYSASADTLVQNNGLPPQCRTMAVIGDSNPRMAYANTTERHRLVFQLLSTVAASGGLATGDTIVITRGVNTFTITMAINAGPTLNNAIAYTGGSPSQDIERTALGIVDVINYRALVSGNVAIRARYISTAETSPGLIELEAFDDSSTGFTVNCAARPAAFNPQLSTLASAQIAHRNRVYFSEPSQPDAVPPLQYVDIGDPDEDILCVRQAMDTAFVIKDRSAWGITGDWPSLRVQRIDATLQVIAPDSCAVLGAQVYALTNQGVVAISNGGAGLVGLPIEADLSFIQVTPVAKRATWACAYDSDRNYLLAVPSSPTDTRAQKIYAYNTLEKTWTRWATPSAGGFLDQFNNVLTYGDDSAASIRTERKSFSRADYRDEVIQNVSGTAINFSVQGYSTTNFATLGYATLSIFPGNTFAPGAPIALLRVGDLLTLASTGEPVCVILGIDEATFTLRVSSAAWFVANGFALVNAYRGYECVVSWLPETAGDPSKAKQAQEVSFHFQSFSGRAETRTASEMAPAQTAVHPFSLPGYGVPALGSQPFGDPSGPRNERALVSRDASRGAYSSITFRSAEAFAFWRLQGRTLEFIGSDERSRR